MVVGAAAVAAPPRPVSIDPAATAAALVVVAAMSVVFWSTRRALQGGGLRFVARAIATLGLALTPIAVVHHLGLVPALDALWPPTRRDLRPWASFLNRNDFAGWLLLATALTLGYLVARLEAHHQASEPLDPDRAFDETGTRLALALSVMSGGIMVSLSRSGLLGVIVGLVLFFAMGRRRLEAPRRRALAASIVALLVVGAVFANLGAISARLQVAMSEGVAGRMSIWTQTWPVVRDFWPVGAGVGGYRRAMALYQTSTRLITIAHADNEPLQIAAEGGALVGIPVVLVMVTFAMLVARRLRHDRTAVFWIRAGAVCGLAGIATQNLVEMTLRVPATGVLAVVLAAIAAHERTTAAPR